MIFEVMRIFVEMKAEEPIESYDKLNPDGLYTYWDYLKWQFAERVELIRGRLFKMSPAPGSLHQTIAGNLFFRVNSIFWAKSCRVFPAPFDVRLPIAGNLKDSTVVQPDLCVVCDEAKLSDSRGCNGAPDLVAEILSPGNSRHEMDTKFHLYEESGVKEYWIIQPESRTVLVYHLINGLYSGLPPFTEGMELHGLVFPDLRFPVDELFHKLPKREG